MPSEQDGYCAGCRCAAYLHDDGVGACVGDGCACQQLVPEESRIAAREPIMPSEEKAGAGRYDIPHEFEPDPRHCYRGVALPDIDPGCGRSLYDPIHTRPESRIAALEAALRELIPIAETGVAAIEDRAYRPQDYAFIKECEAPIANARKLVGL